VTANFYAQQKLKHNLFRILIQLVRTNREGAKDTKEENRREEKDFIIDARIGRYTLSLLTLER
jgi:hypothetical protein